MMIESVLPKLPTSHYFEDDHILTPSVGILSPIAIKTIYEIKELLGQTWLGKVGEPIGCLRKDSNTLLHRDVTAINTDSIREKIAADLFKYLGKDAFIFPETYLSIQDIHPPAASNPLAYYYASDRDIKRSLRVMYKTNYPWNTLKEVFTKSDSEDHQKISLRKFIKQYHRLPSTVFYFENKDKTKKEIEIPLLGGIELLATIKVLGDTNGFGKSGKNVRIAWETANNEVCAARIVKCNSGHSFRFIEEGHAHAQRILNLIEKDNNEIKQIDSLKNIQLDEINELVIHWNALKSQERSAFQQTINRMIEDLTKSKEGLYFCFHRNGSFDRGKTQKFPSSIANLLVSQMKSWLELQKELYHEESAPETLLKASNRFSAQALKDFISAKPNLRQTFTSSDFVIRNILKEISPSNSVFRVPEEGATYTEPSGKRGIRVWFDEQENKWIGNVRKPVKGIQGLFCEPKSLLKKISEANEKVIIKKGTADLFKFLGRTYFLTPDTCLLYKRAQALNKTNSKEILRGTKEPFHLMSKKIEDLEDLCRATTLDGPQEVPILSFIEKHGRPPEFILTPAKAPVPLEGMMELLAALRILNDTYIFDDSGKRIHFIWEKDPLGKIMAARVAKVKLSNFKPHGLDPYKIARDDFSLLMKKDNNPQNYLKSIRVAQNGDLAIFWEALLEKQKKTFIEAFHEMKKKLTEEALFEIFTQPNEFKRPEVISHDFNSRINDLLSDTRRWIKLLNIVYSNDQYEECQKKIDQFLKKKHEPSFDGLPFSAPYCKRDKDFKFVKGEWVSNTEIGEFDYLGKKPDSRWTAKQGQPNSLVNSVLLSPQSPKLQKNSDTIREKIAFDLLSCLSDCFVTPETILSFQNQAKEDSLNPPDAELNRTLYLMSKRLEDFQDLKTAKTRVNKNRSMKVLHYIRKHHVFPDTILTPALESVPAYGVLELLAAIKILGDTDGCGKDGTHAGFQWIRDDSEKIIGAQAVKMDLGSAFEFSDDFRHKFLQSDTGLTDEELIDEGLKDIQMQKESKLTIHWNELKPEQQQQFLDAFQKMCHILKSKKTLHNCVYRENGFRRTRTERFPKKHANVLVKSLRQWVKLQERLYLNKDLISEQSKEKVH